MTALLKQLASQDAFFVKLLAVFTFMRSKRGKSFLLHKFF